MKVRFYAAILLSLIAFMDAFGESGRDTIDLSGTWRFRMDPRDQGIWEKWFLSTLPETVHLPGSMTENGKGDAVTAQTKWTGSIYDSSWFFDPKMAPYREPTNLKIPFWLTPAKHYVGAAWYQKTVMVPADWKNRPLALYLERPHSKTRVWIDGEEIGEQYGFCTAQVFDLSGRLSPGSHTITLCIDNRIGDINVGPDSHSLTDQTQGNWNGVVGQLLLTARPPTWLEDVQVYPDLGAKKAKVVVRIRSLMATGSGTLTLEAESFNTAAHVSTRRITVDYRLVNGADSLVVDLPMGGKVLTWDEFNPALYRLRVRLLAKAQAPAPATDRSAEYRGNPLGESSSPDDRFVEFGMREFRVDGTRFTINGRPVHLRGTVENCVFPLTGYAPMDEPSWERIFRIARSFGLNHMRFHSYCPPAAAFTAADRVGFYLQPEGPSWANHGSSLGDGKPIDRFIYEETDRMDEAYGNHPSFCMLAYGNEPRGGHQAEYLTRFLRYRKAKDNRRVYTGADVGMNWPLVPENDYMVKSGPRGLNWRTLPESTSDYDSVVTAYPVPYVTHEMGQWCAYPDFSEIDKYTGVNKARNYELFREMLNARGMGDEAHRFLMASGELQALCYKMEIEKSLRTKGAGFQLLSLTDYPGQGTAPVGVLNVFWQEKGYIGAGAFSRFCNTTVPLVRLPKFVYTNGETLDASVEVYHYGQAPMPDATVDWILSGDSVIAKGTFKHVSIPIGNKIPVGNIHVPLSGLTRATHLYLEVSIRHTPFVNGWDCWVYPARLASLNDSVYYCTSLDDKAHQVLDAGGKVFLNASGKVEKGKEVVLYFTPVFWNTSWFKMRPPHTLGILCDPENPAFRDFPTGDFGNLQWWDILYKAQPMLLEDFPPAFRPLVQPIDTWFLNRRLGLIFEVRVGKGRLVVSSVDLSPDTGPDKPASRQLYYSIRKYMSSERFNPVSTVDYSVVKALFAQ